MSVNTFAVIISSITTKLPTYHLLPYIPHTRKFPPLYLVVGIKFSTFKFEFGFSNKIYFCKRQKILNLDSSLIITLCPKLLCFFTYYVSPTKRYSLVASEINGFLQRALLKY